jgi:hypothetical protein
MGIFSWFRSHKSADKPDKPRKPRSLIRTRYETPKQRKRDEAAAADVARVQEDDKYFSPDSPAKHEDMW